MATRVCTRCNGSGFILRRDPATGKDVPVTCPKCGGTGEEEIRWLPDDPKGKR